MAISHNVLVILLNEKVTQNLSFNLSHRLFKLHSSLFLSEFSFAEELDETKSALHFHWQILSFRNQNLLQINILTIDSSSR